MRNLLTSIQKRSGLNVALLAMSMNIFCVDLAHALSLTYIYDGNNFEDVDGDIFSTNDRVTARFTIDCTTAHSAGSCANLPYDNYLQLGAVELEPLSFSAGPAGLPTSDGSVEIAQFSFSTDSRGRIVDWDMDLFLFDPSGLINVDTDNRGGGVDSASALGGLANVIVNPGEWRVVSVSLAIDIKPGNKHNNMNPRSKGGIWVAILSDTNPTFPFDPSSQVDIPTVEFGPDGAEAIRNRVKDVNRDGVPDLLLKFKTRKTGISCGDTEATLFGETFDGTPITGSDSLTTVGCSKKDDEGPSLTFTPDEWTLTLDTVGPGIHRIFMIADVSPLAVNDVQDLGGRLIWAETEIELCSDPTYPPNDYGTFISIRDVGDGFLKIGDGFETSSQGEGCAINAAMQMAFDDFGLPNEACLSVRTGGVDFEYCAPLAVRTTPTLLGLSMMVTLE